MDLAEQPITSDRLAQDIADAIHEHRLAPGSKLNEDEVGAIYGVSRTVTRAALQSLAHQRLVELKRNRGAFVAQPSAREAHEVFEARSLLEPHTARAAAERMTEEAALRLRQHIEAEHTATHEGRSGAALHQSGLFHVEIARIAQQGTIEEIIKQLVARSSLVIALYWSKRLALCDSHAHADLVDALTRGDGALAEELMKSHLLDLLASLDLSNVAEPAGSLRHALQR